MAVTSDLQVGRVAKPPNNGIRIYEESEEQEGAQRQTKFNEAKAGHYI